MNSSEHERWNEEMARRFNPDLFITRTAFPIRWMEAWRLRRTAALVGKGGAILDVGCGAGNLTERLKGERVVGIDLSDTLLSLARRRLAGRAGVELLKVAAETLPFPNDRFDRIVCSEVLEHVRSPEETLIEMHRVAKAGARIVITVPNEELINAAKRVVLALGLKKAISGDYPMSDNMLDEWHVNEITSERVRAACGSRFHLAWEGAVPFSAVPFHRVFVLTVRKG